MRDVFKRPLSIVPQPSPEFTSRLYIRIEFWIRAVFLLVLTTCVTKAFGTEQITDQQPYKVSINIEPFSGIFIDPQSTLELDQINDPDYLFRFAPWQKERLYFTSQKGTAWIKISLPEDIKVKPMPLLWLRPPPGVSLNAYISGPNYYRMLPDGRQENSNIYLYNLKPIINKKLDVFIEIPADAADDLQAYLKSPREVLSDQVFTGWQTGWLLALFFVMMMINAINGFKNHHRAYIYLAGICLTGSVFLISWQGLLPISGFELEWQQVLMMNLSLIVSTILLSQIARVNLAGNSVKLIYCFNTLSIIPAVFLLLL